jgi:hypothetical protein
MPFAIPTNALTTVTTRRPPPSTIHRPALRSKRRGAPLLPGFDAERVAAHSLAEMPKRAMRLSHAVRMSGSSPLTLKRCGSSKRPRLRIAVVRVETRRSTSFWPSWIMMRCARGGAREPFGRQASAVMNLLADPLQAAAAANILSAEAAQRGVLVADLIAETLAPEPTAAPVWQDVEPIDDGGFVARRIDAGRVGVLAEVIRETDKAWLIEDAHGNDVWLAKKPCEHHGEDPRGRAILIVPKWLAKRVGVV